MNREDWEVLVEYTLNIGRQMMECGAEAWRAENTMARIFRAYGLVVLDAHALATQAVVTVKLPDGAHYTSTCMVLPENTGTDLQRLEYINATAREICENPPAIAELPDPLDPPERFWSKKELIGYLLGAGAYAVFFGGTVADGLAAACIAVVIYLMVHFRRRHKQHRVIYTLEACFISGVLARLCAGLSLGLNLDMIVIGDIMLFIPGLAMVNGVREIFYSDILTGMYRMVEAVLGTGAIALGYAMALMIGGGLL